MQFLASRIVHAQDELLPVRILVGYQFLRALDSRLHQLFVIDIHAGHKRERLGDDAGLRPVVVLEAPVVRADVRQPVLQLLLTVADIAHHAPQPVLGKQAVNLLRRERLRIATMIPAAVTRVLCIKSYCHSFPPSSRLFINLMACITSFKSSFANS